MKYKYLIVTVVFFLTGFLVLKNITATNNQNLADRVPNNVSNRSNQMPATTANEMNRLTPPDRVIISKQFSGYAEAIAADPVLAAHCTRRTGKEDETCGIIDARRGDPHFRPETLPKNSAEHQYAKIPRNSKITVSTACEQDGKFYTRVNYTDENGHERPFINPFNSQQKCITSPGLYQSPKYPHYQTQLPRSFNASGHLTEWHIVSENKSYAGAQMAWSLWLNDSGYAYHAEADGFPATGYPESAGCFRMSDACARGLFFLARRVGTDSINFNFNGYGHPTENRACTRPENDPAPGNLKFATQQDSSVVRKNIESRRNNWWSRFWGGVKGGTPSNLPQHQRRSEDSVR